MSSHDLVVERDVFDNAGNPKNIDFPWGNAYFYKISFFAFDVNRYLK